MAQNEENTPVDEIKNIINDRGGQYLRNYLPIRYAYNRHYDWPEMDTLRHEICLCILFGLWQSAMTLTNHMLESFMKFALTYTEADTSGTKAGDTVSEIAQMTAKYRRTHSSRSLEQTINYACTIGLISKEQKRQLKSFKDKFRNPYAHADRERMYGNELVTAQGVTITESGIEVEKPQKRRAVELEIVHAHMQAKHAEEYAIPYFLYLDRLVRELMPRIFRQMPSNDAEGESESSAPTTEPDVS